jgi:hypothetical protein
MPKVQPILAENIVINREIALGFDHKKCDKAKRFNGLQVESALRRHSTQSLSSKSCANRLDF